MKAERVTNKLHAQLQHFHACILTLKVFTFWLLKVANFFQTFLYFFLIVQLISHQRLVIMMYVSFQMVTSLCACKYTIMHADFVRVEG